MISLVNPNRQKHKILVNLSMDKNISFVNLSMDDILSKSQYGQKRR